MYAEKVTDERIEYTDTASNIPVFYEESQDYKATCTRLILFRLIQDIDIPELVPKACSKRSCTCRPDPTEACKRPRNSNGITPRTPPPSTLRIRAPAVAGFNLAINLPCVRHSIHVSTSNWHSFPIIGSPNIITQISQMACPHVRTCSGLRRRQNKQVV